MFIVDPAGGIRPVQIGGAVGIRRGDLKGIRIQGTGDGIGNRLGTAGGGEVGNQNLGAVSSGGSNRLAVSVHIVVKNQSNLAPSGIVRGSKAVSIFGRDDAVGSGPVHSGFGIIGNAGFVGIILSGGGGRARPAPEDGGDLLTGNGVVDPESSVAVAIDQAPVRRPAGGARIVGRCRHIGESGGSGGGGAACRPVEDCGELGAGHVVIHAKAPVIVAVDVPLLGNPLNGLSIGAPGGHVGKFRR